MTLIKLVDKIVALFEEFIYMIIYVVAYCVLKIWEYRAVIIIGFILSSMAMIGLIGYGIKTNY